MMAYILHNLVPLSVMMRETEGPANVVDGPSVYELATCRWYNWEILKVPTCAYREIQMTLRRKHARHPHVQ